MTGDGGQLNVRRLCLSVMMCFVCDWTKANMWKTMILWVPAVGARCHAQHSWLSEIRLIETNTCEVGPEQRHKKKNELASNAKNGGSEQKKEKWRKRSNGTKNPQFVACALVGVYLSIKRTEKRSWQVEIVYNYKTISASATLESVHSEPSHIDNSHQHQHIAWNGMERRTGHARIVYIACIQSHLEMKTMEQLPCAEENRSAAAALSLRIRTLTVGSIHPFLPRFFWHSLTQT